MYDKGLAERLTERVGDMFEMEVTYMFGGFGYMMNEIGRASCRERV